MSVVIKNGHVIDPASNTSAPLDVLIIGDRIARIGTDLRGSEVLDATGCIVCPGLVDIHVHFREPGFESKETIATGSRAAARGGVTSVVTMPNTKPPIDNAGMIEFCNRRARETACIKVWPSAAATKGREGVEMTDIVHYAMPYGVLGLAVHKLVVAKKLEQIFEFRRRKLATFWQ